MALIASDSAPVCPALRWFASRRQTRAFRSPFTSSRPAWPLRPTSTPVSCETVQDMFTCITPLYQQHASHTLASRAYGPRPHNPAELTSYRTIPRPSQLWWPAREASGCDGQHEHSEYTVVVNSRIRDSRDGQHEQRRCAVFNTLESDRRGQSQLEPTELKWPFHLGISSLPRVAAAGVYCWF